MPPTDPKPTHPIAEPPDTDTGGKPDQGLPGGPGTDRPDQGLPGKPGDRPDLGRPGRPGDPTPPSKPEPKK
jgi:hypothetical protein